MKLKLIVYGLDGNDARELEDLLWSTLDIADVKTRYRTRDSLPPGQIQAVASTPVMQVVLTYVALKLGDEALKDVYAGTKARVKKLIEDFQVVKNEGRAPRQPIRFSISEEGELTVKGEDD